MQYFFSDPTSGKIMKMYPRLDPDDMEEHESVKLVSTGWD